MSTNIGMTHVIQPLKRLFLSALGGRIKLYLQDRYETRGSSFVLARFLSDEETAREGFAVTYTYRLGLRYYRRVGRDLDGDSGLSGVVQDVEDIKAAISGNRSYSEAGVYRWHEAVIESVDYAPELEGDELADPMLRVVSMELAVTVTAAI